MDSSRTLTFSWWRAAAAAVLCVAVGAAAALSFAGPSGEATVDESAAADAFAALSSGSLEVTTTFTEAPLAAVSGTAQPEGSDLAAGVTVTETGVVDFAAGTASITPPEVDEMAAMEGPLVPAVAVAENGALLTTRWADVWAGVELDGVEGIWVRDGLLPVGVNGSETSLPTVVDLVANDVLDPATLTDAGAGVWRGSLDTGELTALEAARLDALDDALTAVVVADYDSGSRARPSGPWELSISDGTVDALRVEFAAGEFIFTVTWWMAPTGEKPTGAPDGATSEYATFREAFDNRFTVDPPIDPELGEIEDMVEPEPLPEPVEPAPGTPEGGPDQATATVPMPTGPIPEDVPGPRG